MFHGLSVTLQRSFPAVPLSRAAFGSAYASVVSTRHERPVRPLTAVVERVHVRP